MAVYDALGHSLGVPISVLLGGKHAGPIETSRAISTDTSEKMAAAARRNRKAGYRTIKIKTGSNAKAELDAIRVIREENPDLRLKLDANQGWKLTEALRFLDEAAKYDIYVVEQPLDSRDFKGSAELRRRISIPVMLDEAIHGPADALRAISEGAADYINIKLLKTGGLYPAAQIAVIAAAAGIGCQIGTLSTSIGSGAAVHLVHAHPVIGLPEVAWPDRLRENPAAGFTVKDGFADVPNKPGLGLVVNDDIAAGIGFA
jgi:L-alanine-DL-glutamate epimerase-like enolase superfamily enzyme